MFRMAAVIDGVEAKTLLAKSLHISLRFLKFCRCQFGGPGSFCALRSAVIRSSSWISISDHVMASLPIHPQKSSGTGGTWNGCLAFSLSKVITPTVGEYRVRGFLRRATRDWDA